jgi:hypothetical protein
LYGTVVCLYRWKAHAVQRLTGRHHHIVLSLAKYLRRITNTFLAFWCLFIFMVMHVSVVGFSVDRAVAAEAGGPSVQDNTWGFGQVMALATWLPTFLDFFITLHGEHPSCPWLHHTDDCPA